MGLNYYIQFPEEMNRLREHGFVLTTGGEVYWYDNIGDDSYCANVRFTGLPKGVKYELEVVYAHGKDELEFDYWEFTKRFADLQSMIDYWENWKS